MELKIESDIPVPSLYDVGLTNTLKEMRVGDSFWSDTRPNRSQMFRLKPKKWTTRVEKNGEKIGYRTWRIE